MPNITRVTQADKMRMRELAKELEERIKKDPAMAQKLKTEPREVLGALGMPEDAQNEYLRSQGALALPCSWTCLRTCFITDW